MSLAKNTVFNVAGAGVPLFISLASVPIYLHHIGLERYGVLSLCWLLLGYLGLFDFGLGRALTQKLAAMRDADPAERSAIFWLGLFASAVMGIVAAVVALVVLPFALGQMRFEASGMMAEVTRSIPLLALTLPVALIAGVFTGALIGRDRFGMVSVSDMLTSILATILPLAVAILYGPDLSGLVIASLAARLIPLVLLISACIGEVPLHRPRRAPPRSLGSMLQYGGWVSASNIVSPIMSFLDRFAIGSLIGARSVSYYVIPFNLVMRMTILPDALSRALFPRYAVADRAGAATLIRDGVATISVILSPLAVAMIALVSPFLQLWVGRAVAEPATAVAYLLIPGYWINCFALIAYNQLQAQGRPDISAKIHMAEILPFVVFLFVGLKLFGLPGAAAVWTLRTSLDAVAMFHFSAARTEPLRRLAVTGVLIWTAAVAGLVLPRLSPASIVLFALIFVAVSVIAIRTAPPAARAKAGAVYGQAMRRLRPMRQGDGPPA